MDMVLLLGVVTGMRCFTAIAIFCWAVWLGLIPELGWAVWSSYLAAAILFTICAAGEWIADTLPKTPPRTELWPATCRVVVAGLVGALVATAIDEPVAGGVLFGAVGAVVGTWGGFFVRMTIARLFRRDFPAALLETASAIALAISCIVTLHRNIVMDLQKTAR